MKIIAPAIWIVSVLNGFNSAAQEYKPLPQAVVYKTKGNYSNLVPVTLSDDGSSIVSYPAIEDIRAALGSARPSKLAKGYLLDNGGRVNKHVAFLNMSFDAYSKLAEPPPLKEMYLMITDKAPLLALYDCGLKGKATSRKQLNKLIRKHKLSSCKAIN